MTSHLDRFRVHLTKKSVFHYKNSWSTVRILQTKLIFDKENKKESVTRQPKEYRIKNQTGLTIQIKRVISKNGKT